MSLLLGACGYSPSRCKAVQPGQYFPTGALDQSTERWFGRDLCAMKEEPLARLPADEAYRFLWLRSFHHPVSVRIERSRGTATLFAIELNGVGEEPGTVERRAERALDAQEWSGLVAAVGAARFWDAPAKDPAAEIGMDGAEWTLEGHRQGVYHVVTRWSPGPGPFRAACDAFLRASRFSFAADEVY